MSGRICCRSLSYEWLSSQNLQGADLSDADLREADLRGAELNGADLSGADLTNASLGGAKLSGANLSRANLSQTKLDFSHADLRDADLSHLELPERDFEGSDLSGASLQFSNLTSAILRDAKLNGADLQGSDISGADFNGASLRDANLADAKGGRTAKGLVEEQLGGAALLRAELPEDLRESKRLPLVEEASKNAKRIFLWMQLASAYCWLTVYTTTDAGLLTNSPSSTLPVIGSNVPIVGFYWVVPILLVVFYIYFHLYLQRLWEVLALMPAVFQDGRTLDKAVYPWMITGLVHSYFPRLEEYRPPLYALQRLAILISVWFVVPGTIVRMWWRFLVRQDVFGTFGHVACELAAVVAGVMIYRLAKRTLRGESNTAWKDLWQMTRRQLAASVIGVLLFCSFSGLAIYGVPSTEDEESPSRLKRRPRLKRLPRPNPEESFIRAAFPFRANFQDADVSKKPTHWTAEEPFLTHVKGARLRGRNLRYLEAEKAFLARADLTGADLSFAELQRADLREADLVYGTLTLAHLSGANLSAANLEGAQLSGADLFGANLSQATLARAVLYRTNLYGANLRGASLHFANFAEVVLNGADLGGADLTFAKNLCCGQLKAARDWEKAYRDNELACGAELPEPSVEGSEE